MAALLHKLQRLRHSIESDGPVDHRLHVIALDSRGHLFEHSPAPHGQPDNVQVLPEEARDQDLLREPPQPSNYKDCPPDLRGFDRLLQWVLAAYFDDVVDPTARPIRSSLSPFGN